MITPDWTFIGTYKNAEKELVDFIWNGPGIYKKNGISVLVVPTNRSAEKTWHYKRDLDELFYFNVYDGRDIGEILNLLNRAPSRN